jgi:uncharacterized protein
VPRHDSTAIALLELGCRHAEAAACVKLGTLFEAGEHVAQNYERAARLYRRSCGEFEYGEGCARLAQMYTRGAGVHRDSSEAAQLTREACKLGHTASCPKRRSS